MSQTEVVEIIIAAFGALLTLTQVLGLFILADVRARISRLEGIIMEGRKP